MGFLIISAVIFGILYAISYAVGWFNNWRLKCEREKHLARLKSYHLANACKNERNVIHLNSLPYGRRIDDGQKHEWDEK